MNTIELSDSKKQLSDSVSFPVNLMLTNRSSSGAALIVVLILSAIIYLAVSTALLMTMTEIHLSDFERRSIQAFYLAESAIAKGVARLRTAPDNLTLFSDTVPGKLDAFTVSFTPVLHADRNSWYQLVLQGEGVISGSSASLKRRVQRDILLKPFALFADEQLVIRENCRIAGNIHGNQQVDIGANVKVDGHVSVSSALSNAIVSEDAVLPEDEEPALEPYMGFPEIPSAAYLPKYIYKNKEYSAQNLELDASIALSEPSDYTLDVYRGRADLENNPAGIFFLNVDIDDDDEANKTLTAIDLQGGSLVLPGTKIFRVRGLVRISPAKNFPALIHLGTDEVRLRTIGFETLLFSDTQDTEIGKLPKKNNIEGLFYSAGSIALTAESGSVSFDGSIWARNISLKGNASCKVDFAPELLASPPPGLNVVEYGEWREIFE